MKVTGVNSRRTSCPAISAHSEKRVAVVTCLTAAKVPPGGWDFHAHMGPSDAAASHSRHSMTFEASTSSPVYVTNFGMPSGVAVPAQRHARES